MSDRDQPTDDLEIGIGIEIPNSTPERFKYLIGRKNDKEFFGMPPGSVTIERVRECVAPNPGHAEDPRVPPWRIVAADC
jgi:hypothetical protein